MITSSCLFLAAALTTKQEEVSGHKLWLRARVKKRLPEGQLQKEKEGQRTSPCLVSGASACGGRGRETTTLTSGKKTPHRIIS